MKIKIFLVIMFLGMVIKSASAATLMVTNNSQETLQCRIVWNGGKSKFYEILSRMSKTLNSGINNIVAIEWSFGNEIYRAPLAVSRFKLGEKFAVLGVGGIYVYNGKVFYIKTEPEKWSKV